MIEIDGKIVSADLLREGFCCDLARCRGICCVEGNAGAPLEKDEAAILEREYPAYKSYLKPAGIEAIGRQGFMVLDEDGDRTTPLIHGGECAYSFEQNGITFCAVEHAYNEGKTDFIKPVSCHLYPIRLTTFNDKSVGLNYHRWSVCAGARKLGGSKNIPVYRAVQDALIRKFGKDFFEALTEAERFLREEEGK